MISRAVRPKNGGPDTLSREYARDRQPVGGELQQVGFRDLGHVLGRRPVGLVVDDQDRNRSPATSRSILPASRRAGPRPGGEGFRRRSPPPPGPRARTGRRTPDRAARPASRRRYPCVRQRAACAARSATKDLRGGGPARARQRRQVLEQGVREDAAQEARILRERGRRQDRRLGKAADGPIHALAVRIALERRELRWSERHRDQRLRRCGSPGPGRQTGRTRPKPAHAPWRPRAWRSARWRCATRRVRLPPRSLRGGRRGPAG